MSYELGFLDEALKEWKKLDGSTREQFKSRLAERLENPRVLSAKLIGHPDLYKIKLRSIGYRLVYEVRDRELIVIVVAMASVSATPFTKRPTSADLQKNRRNATLWL